MKRKITPLGWAALVFVISVIAIIVWTLAQTHQQTGKLHIQIVAVPNDAVVKLNGQIVDKSTYVVPGNYSVTGYKDGFLRKSYQLDITDQDQKVFVLLSPSSDDATKWVSDNQSAYQEAKTQVEQQVLGPTKAFVSKNPIIKDLPYENYLYKISYRLDPSDTSGQSIIITVDAPEQYRNMAIAKIANLGYDPSAYTYEYANFANIFKETE